MHASRKETRPDVPVRSRGNSACTHFPRYQCVFRIVNEHAPESPGAHTSAVHLRQDSETGSGL